MNKFFIILTMMFFCQLGFSQTPGCSDSQAAISAMWDKYGGWSGNITLSEWVQKKSNALQLWNLLNQNGWGNIGARSLDYGESENGNIVGQTKRTFVLPPSFNETVTITIHKTDGKANTGVSVCSTRKNGQTTELDTHTFPNGNQNMSKTFSLHNVKGRVLSVAIRNYSVGNKFTYTISADN
ncbi:MAG: hypothetical protein WAT79_11015 [Saprospiraceae bacterium]